MDFNESPLLERFCRVCMAIAQQSEGFCADIYSPSECPDQPSLRVMLGIICPAVFPEELPHGYSEDGRMPHRVCPTCERAIGDAYRLHQTCVETDRKLGELLAIKQEPSGDENGYFENVTADAMVDIGVVKVETRDHEEPTGYSADEKPLETATLNKDIQAGSSKDSKGKSGSKNQKRVKVFCEHCSEKFNSYVRLNKHLEQNHPDHVYSSCKICKKIFLNEAQYEQHRLFHITGKRYGCQFCEKRFGCKRSLEAHLDAHTNATPSLCPECGITFKNVDSLRNHIMRHKTQPKFPCQQCPVKSASMAKFKEHMLTHTKEKNHVCEICGSRFTVAFSLQTHMKNVHGDRKFSCDTCNVKFSCPNHLKRHKRTHTGEKPYVCAYCDRAYVQSNDLVKHSKIHVGETPYACDRCSESFRTSTELRNHYGVHFSEAEAKATGAMFGEIANKAIFSIREILKRRFEAEQQQKQLKMESKDAKQS